MEQIRQPVRQIVVATDFSECSRAAVDAAADLAQRLGAKLTIVHVWQMTPLSTVGAEYGMPDLIVAIEDAARAQLADEMKRVSAVVPQVESELRSGVAWEQIVEAATRHSADLLIVGTHGRTGLRHVFLGSVAEKVVRTSPVPVLTIPLPTLAKTA